MESLGEDEIENVYNVLGLDEMASDSIIAKRVRQLSLKYHPDRGGDVKMFHKIIRAKDILLDPKLRKQVDKKHEIKRKQKERHEQYDKKRKEMVNDLLRKEKKFAEWQNQKDIYSSNINYNNNDFNFDFNFGSNENKKSNINKTKIDEMRMKHAAMKQRQQEEDIRKKYKYQQEMNNKKDEYTNTNKSYKNNDINNEEDSKKDGKIVKIRWKRKNKINLDQDKLFERFRIYGPIIYIKIGSKLSSAKIIFENSVDSVKAVRNERANPIWKEVFIEGHPIIDNVNINNSMDETLKTNGNESNRHNDIKKRNPIIPILSIKDFYLYEEKVLNSFYNK